MRTQDWCSPRRSAKRRAKNVVCGRMCPGGAFVPSRPRRVQETPKSSKLAFASGWARLRRSPPVSLNAWDLRGNERVAQAHLPSCHFKRSREAHGPGHLRQSNNSERQEKQKAPSTPPKTSAWGVQLGKQRLTIRRCGQPHPSQICPGQ